MHMNNKTNHRKKSTSSGRHETIKYAMCDSCVNRGYVFIRCSNVFSCRVGGCKRKKKSTM